MELLAAHQELIKDHLLPFCSDNPALRMVNHAFRRLVPVNKVGIYGYAVLGGAHGMAAAYAWRQPGRGISVSWSGSYQS